MIADPNERALAFDHRRRSRRSRGNVRLRDLRHRLVGMIYDYVKRRMVHPVYLVGIGIVLMMKFDRSWIRGTQTWNDFTAWLATFYVQMRSLRGRFAAASVPILIAR